MGRFNLKALVILALGHLVTDIYQGALPATLPFLKDKLGLTYTMAGVILMVANFTSSVCSPFSAIIPTRRKKRFFFPLAF